MRQTKLYELWLIILIYFWPNSRINCTFSYLSVLLICVPHRSIVKRWSTKNTIVNILIVWIEWVALGYNNLPTRGFHRTSSTIHLWWDPSIERSWKYGAHADHGWHIYIRPSQSSLPMHVYMIRSRRSRENVCTWIYLGQNKRARKDAVPLSTLLPLAVSFLLDGPNTNLTAMRTD